MLRQRIGPHRTDAVHWPLMVEVQELELVLGARQVDFEGVWARRAVEAADATEGGHTESVNKRRLVVPVSMADKGRPQCLAEACPHVLGEARRRRADQGAPALLATAYAHLVKSGL